MLSDRPSETGVLYREAPDFGRNRPAACLLNRPLGVLFWTAEACREMYFVVLGSCSPISKQTGAFCTGRCLISGAPGANLCLLNGPLFLFSWAAEACREMYFVVLGSCSFDHQTETGVLYREAPDFGRNRPVACLLNRPLKVLFWTAEACREMYFVLSGLFIYILYIFIYIFIYLFIYIYIYIYIYIIKYR